MVGRDELAALPRVIALSRRARRVVVADLVIAATIIVGLVSWDLVQNLPLPIGDEGSTVLVGRTACGCCAGPPGGAGR